MTRYTTRPSLAWVHDDNEWSDGEVEGREVYDDGSWSEDQPTGLLNASGDMIWRCGRRIGFLADE